MIVDLEAASAKQAYFLLSKTLIPRPIAWVLSENSQGGLNLAPFSYFSGVCSDPPLLMLSIGKKSDGTPKDSRANIQERRDFVIHIPDRPLLKSMVDSSGEFPEEVSEVEMLQLGVSDFPGSRLPRLTDCPIAYGCTLYRIEEIGPKGQAMILGEVKTIYMADEVAEGDPAGRIQIHTDRIDVLGRLGGDEYYANGKILRVPRPK
ncbi:MAG: flavin reductase family protein [Magnetococcales bacterium]|nr:flavin reductase family protein [Magnetococcales bacterium]